MKSSHRYRSATRQRGAALVIGLVMLLALTLLAVSGIRTATLELDMAGNTQYAQNAFQAAEVGIERTLARGDFNTLAPVITNEGVGGTDNVTTTTVFMESTLPLSGTSMGSDFASLHFQSTATGTSLRGASAVNLQGFYVQGPAQN